VAGGVEAGLASFHVTFKTVFLILNNTLFRAHDSRYLPKKVMFS